MTAQAEAANARFLAFAPPPEGGAAAVCLVDTGADVNPDTERSLVERLALGGEDPGDVHRTKHGTRMAMLMGGPVNDWGSVGIWPHVRIVSVRAMPAGATRFPFHHYEQAVLLCSEHSEREQIRVVNLSLGGAEHTPDELERLRDRLGSVRGQGINVVAAAGNGEGQVEYPAAVDPAVAVGGATASDSLCPFSARGPQLDILAPGCDLDAAYADGRPARANGTSDAAAITSALLAALRSYRPGLSPADAEALVVQSAHGTAAGPLIDAEAAFRAAGLAAVVEAGRAADPARPSEPPTVIREPEPRAEGEPAAESVPARPHVASQRWRRGRLTVTVDNRPGGATLVAAAVYRSRRGEFRLRSVRAERARDRVSLRAPRRWGRVELHYRSARGLLSPVRVVRARTSPTERSRP